MPKTVTDVRFFESELQIIKEFRGKPQRAWAEVAYTKREGIPVFQSVKVGGTPVPLSYFNHSELIKAYSESGGTSL